MNIIINQNIQKWQKNCKKNNKNDAILDGEDNGGNLIGFKGIFVRCFGKLI